MSEMNIIDTTGSEADRSNMSAMNIMDTTGSEAERSNIPEMNIMDTTGSEANRSSSDDESIADEETSGNATWANAMSKILSTTAKTEKLILSKAKKDSDIASKKVKEIEMVDSSGKVVESKSEKKKDVQSEIMKNSLKEKQKKKAEWEAMCRVKPDIIKKEKERELVKIATRGVVHLFNTVEEHQKTVKTKKSSNSNKKPNAVKGAFMDMLKQHSGLDKKLKEDPVVEKAKQEETWSILKDDFMMGAEMKDWDKASDDET